MYKKKKVSRKHKEKTQDDRVLMTMCVEPHQTVHTDDGHIFKSMRKKVGRRRKKRAGQQHHSSKASS